MALLASRSEPDIILSSMKEEAVGNWVFLFIFRALSKKGRWRRDRSDCILLCLDTIHESKVRNDKQSHLLQGNYLFNVINILQMLTYTFNVHVCLIICFKRDLCHISAVGFNKLFQFENIESEY